MQTALRSINRMLILRYGCHGLVQASQPVLARSKDLHAFLDASEEDWSPEVARANHEAAGGGNACAVFDAVSKT